MFNLNIPAAALLNVDNGGGVCTTPKTPEIVNTLIAMTNPLDSYSFTIETSTGINQQQSINNSTSNQQLISQDSSHSSCSGSPLDSPAGASLTPSVQQTCSQFIKAGLKITIQNKRKMSSGDSSSGTEQNVKKSRYQRKSITGGDTSEEDTIEQCHKSLKTGLTPEDEDRRKRRRERNKIAATKCRMKKRERTQNLISESEQLETQNIDLKSQVRNLEIERRKLFDMLQSHSNTCVRPDGYQPSSNLCQSPAYKYLRELGFCDSSSQQQDFQQQQQQIQQQSSSSQRQIIPSVNTIKFSRNTGLRQQQQQQSSNTTTVDLLAKSYCKPSRITRCLNAPHQQDLATTCVTNSPTRQQSQQICQNSGTTGLIKNDYIPNCENSNGGTSVCSTNIIDTCTTSNFVLKHELVDSQSPYTTAQSAERFLFETNCENFDIKHTNSLSNNNCNNNNTSSHNNNNIVDFNTQLISTPTSCQTAYDSLLIKNDFLSNDPELLTQLTDTTDAEFTDLDSGITAYSHMTNEGGCLA